MVSADREPPILLLPPLSHHRHVDRFHRTRTYTHKDPQGLKLTQGFGERSPDGRSYHHGHGYGPHPRPARTFAEAVPQRSQDDSTDSSTYETQGDQEPTFGGV